MTAATYFRTQNAIGDGRSLRSALDQALPEWLKDVSEIAVDDADDTAWARGAAAAALKELYGAPWNTTGPVRPRNLMNTSEREAT